MLDLNLGGYSCQVSAFIFPTKFDLILGRSWLKQHSPRPNWNSDTWSLGHGDQMIRLMPTYTDGGSLDNFTVDKSSTKARPQLSYLISKNQVNNCLQNGSSGFLLYMKDVISEATLSENEFNENGVDEWISSFLQEFSTVFLDTLPGLPQDIGFQHVINLQPDAKPVNRTPYKMSPANLMKLENS